MATKIQVKNKQAEKTNRNHNQMCYFPLLRIHAIYYHRGEKILREIKNTDGNFKS